MPVSYVPARDPDGFSRFVMVTESRESDRSTAGKMTVTAPAKLNLTLVVKHRRDDGFHEIESLVIAVSLFDELTITNRPEPGIELVCDNEKIPCDSRNLVHQAAVLLAADAGVTPAVRIHLHKHIPTGAGLGGGSSDAAAILIALDRWWKLGYATTRLAEIGATIGSDVPLFFHLPAAIIRGRGEQVEPVTFSWPGWFALILPELVVSTPEVYRRWRPAKEGSSVREPRAHQALAAQHQPAERLSAALGNMLDVPAFSVSPALADLHVRVQVHCPGPVHLSGSGSALFTLFDHRHEAEDFARNFQQELGTRTDIGLSTQLVQGLAIALE